MIIAILVGAIVVVALVFVCRYNSLRDAHSNMTWRKTWSYKDIAELTYDEFLKFYQLNPEKWTLESDDITYGNKYRIIISSYKDYRLYYKFYKNHKEKKEEEKLLNSNLAFCKEMQKDCDRMKRESQQKIEQSKQQSMDIIQQYFANERAKKEKKADDYGTLDPTCWPASYPRRENPKIKVGKIYRQVLNGVEQYGFMNLDGNISIATTDFMKNFLASIYGKYETIYDVPNDEMPWDKLIKTK